MSDPHPAPAIGRRHPCAWCGTDNYASATKCRVCGTVLRNVARTVKCPACRCRQSAVLLVCRQCGQEMRPVPRPVPWLIPVLMTFAVLFILLRA